MLTRKTIQAALSAAIQTLMHSETETPRLDAEVLLANILRRDRSWLFAHNRDMLSPVDDERFTADIHRRLAHEPVAHILGKRDFFGLTFDVSPAVLIPRPETEMIVAYALAHMPPHARVLDVGTGSGCIAVSLAVHAPSVSVIATDISADALAVAKRNITAHHVSAQVLPVQMDLLSAIHGKFHAILSNPPYIALAESPTLPADVRAFEPHQALFSGDDGLAHLKQISRMADQFLLPHGWILLEFGATQGSALLSAAHQLQPAASFSIQKDLAGRDRLLLGKF